METKNNIQTHTWRYGNGSAYCVYCGNYYQSGMDMNICERFNPKISNGIKELISKDQKTQNQVALICLINAGGKFINESKAAPQGQPKEE